LLSILVSWRELFKVGCLGNISTARLVIAPEQEGRIIVDSFRRIRQTADTIWLSFVGSICTRENEVLCIDWTVDLKRLGTSIGIKA